MGSRKECTESEGMAFGIGGVLFGMIWADAMAVMIPQDTTNVIMLDEPRAVCRSDCDVPYQPRSLALQSESNS